MNFLYNTGIHLYSFCARVASLRSRKVTLMLRGQKSTLASLVADAADKEGREGYDIWFHVASLGEFEQARPLIEKLRQTQPRMRILLSFFSPSGYEVRKNYDKVDKVVYLPFDTPRKVRKFLDAARPRNAVFVKYEFWGNFLEQLQRRAIPTYLVSAIFRPDQRFFRRGGGMFRKMLDRYTKIYVQDTASRLLLEKAGVDNVAVTGDTRFDRVNDIKSKSGPVEGFDKFCSGSDLTLTIGSSWPPDEDIYLPWLHGHPGVKAIIAPHEFDEHRIAELRKRLGGDITVTYSDYQALIAEGHKTEADAMITRARYVIINCFGLLSRLYRHGDVAYVGGGFGAGIHNINEAAVYGIPVIFGPKYHKFKEAIDLIGLRGGFTVKTKEDFAALADSFVSDATLRKECGAAAGAYISQSIGATDRILSDISAHL